MVKSSDPWQLVFGPRDGVHEQMMAAKTVPR